MTKKENIGDLYRDATDSTRQLVRWTRDNARQGLEEQKWLDEADAAKAEEGRWAAEEEARRVLEEQEQ